MRVHGDKQCIRIRAQMQQSDACAGPAHPTELKRSARIIEYIEAIVREWVNGQIYCQLLESKLSIVRERVGWVGRSTPSRIRRNRWDTAIEGGAGTASHI